MAKTNTPTPTQAPPRPPSSRHVRATTLLLLALTLQSCFTMTVWGFEVEEDTDISTGQQENVMVYDATTEWSWKLFGLRVLITPVALALDCATAPLQAFLLWNTDDDC